MRVAIIIAAIFAAANADGHEDAVRDERKDDWNMDMDHHHKGPSEHDWKDMECMMSEWGCDSAASLGATATVLAATMAALL